MENNKQPSSKKGLIFAVIFSLIGLCILAVCCVSIVLIMKNGGSTEAGYYEFPKQENVVETKTWGRVPVNQVLVMLKEGESKSVVEQIAAEYNGAIIGEFEYINLFQIEISSTTKEELKEIVETIAKNPSVDAVTPNIAMTAQDIKGKPCTLLDDIYKDGKNANPYKLIGLEEAWQYIDASGVKLNDVHVGIIDDGMNSGALDGNGKVKFETPEVKDSNTDDESHGTAVANVIAGNWDNGGTRGVAGGLNDKLKVSFSNVFDPTIPFKATVAVDDPKDITQGKDHGTTYSFNTLVEMQKQIKGGATIINYSMGIPPQAGNADINKIYRRYLTQVMKDNPKVLFVAAAGNQANKPNTPALDGTNRDLGGIDLPNVITVGAVDNNGDKASFSNPATGKGEVTLSASGVEVPLGTEPDGSVRKWDGTSFSTPQVSAAAAIIRSINPDLNAEDIKKLLVKTADSEISNPAFSDKIKTVDPAKNGKVMRLDKAVLEAINNLPADKKPKIDLTPEFLKKVGKVESVAKQDKNDLLSFRIIATIPGVGEKGTDVQVTFNGPGALGGLSKQHISSAGDLEWGFSFMNEKDTASVKITRIDSRACSILNLKVAPEYVGKYEGIASIPLPYAQYLNKSAVDIDVTATIDTENKIIVSAGAKGSISISEGGFTISSNYDLTSSSNGTIDPETLEFTTTGTYNSKYSVSAPPEIMQGIPAGMSSGEINGTENAQGKYSENQLSGTLTFVGGGSSGEGTFTIQKVE